MSLFNFNSMWFYFLERLNVVPFSISVLRSFREW